MEKVQVNVNTVGFNLRTDLAGSLNLYSYKFKNCQPCHFSPYQMLKEKNCRLPDAQSSIDSALKILSYWVTDTNNPSHTELLKKLNFYHDFSSLRYIVVYDDSKSLATINVDIPMLYSAIIKYVPQEKHACLYWNQYFSDIYKFSNCETPIEESKYDTIWQKHYFVHVNEEQAEIRDEGTFSKADFADKTGRQYYSIDDYFLKFLFANQTNNECVPFTSEVEENNAIQQQIHADYKLHLPALVKNGYLDFLDRELKPCIFLANKNIGSTHFNPQEMVFFKDESLEPYALPSTTAQKIDTIRIEICESLGGVMQPITSMVDILLETCKYDTKVIKNEGNEIYTLNCSNIEEIISSNNDRNEIIERYGCSTTYGSKISLIEEL